MVVFGFGCFFFCFLCGLASFVFCFVWFLFDGQLGVPIALHRSYEAGLQSRSGASEDIATFS